MITKVTNMIELRDYIFFLDEQDFDSNTIKDDMGRGFWLLHPFKPLGGEQYKKPKRFPVAFKKCFDSWNGTSFYKDCDFPTAKELAIRDGKQYIQCIQTEIENKIQNLSNIKG